MKTLKTLFCILLWQTYGFAQIDTSTMLGSIHYSFSKLDSANVPTHILIDRTLPLGHEEYFAGNGDSLCTIKQYKQIYLDMFNASYNSFLQLPDLDTLYQRASAYLDNDIFPISISKFDFNYIKAEALDSGWMDYDSVEQRYVDVAGKNPYSSASVFVAAVFNPVTWQGQVTFTLANDLLFTNSDINRDSIEIDFGDGTGYHSISVGQTINIDYSEFEDGSIITIRVRVKSGDAILLSNTEFIIAKANGTNPDAYININDAFRSTYNVCNLNNGYSAGDARAYIQYANPFIPVLTRPIIIVEGFDVDKNPNDNRYGNLGWHTFKTGISYTEDGKKTALQLANLPLLMDRLKAEGYDVIIVDFKNGGKRIESNALSVMSIIQWANATKAGSSDICVMGASMGGLIARYSLKYMEEQGCNPCTRFYATFDSPHRGANIPLGVQHFVRFFAQINADAKDTYEKTLSSVAAMQMLIYHTNPSSAYYRPQWQTLLNNMGHPEKPFRVSMINGASTGIGLGFSAGSQTIQYYSYWGVLEVMGNAWSVPNSPFTSSGQVVFAGKAPKNSFWTAFLNVVSPLSKLGVVINHYTSTQLLGFPTLPVDNAPGGKTETYGDIAGASYQLGQAYSLVGDDHCFIPSVSAMDIGSNILGMDIWSEVNSNPSSTPFDKWYFPDIEDGKYNQKHVEVTIGSSGNIEWIISQLNQNEPYTAPQNLPNASGSNFNYALPIQKHIRGGNIQVGMVVFYSLMEIIKRAMEQVKMKMLNLIQLSIFIHQIAQ